MKAKVIKPKRLPRVPPGDDSPRSSTVPVKGFGILKDKPVDGLAYQKRLRAEWDGR